MTGGTGSCTTCAGRCCRSYLVPVSGYDVWLISTRQRLGPEQFVVTHPQKEPGSDGFLLARDHPRMALALDKQGPFRATQPCVFLMELAGGELRCGVYEDRPGVCRTYPMSIWKGVVSQRPDTFCPPDTWGNAHDGLRPWRDELQRLRMRWDVYSLVVEHWNERVEEVSPDRQFGLMEYLGYLLNVYDRLARLDAELGPARLASIAETWPNLPREEPALQETGSLPWQEYLDRTQQVVDCFFPGR